MALQKIWPDGATEKLGVAHQNQVVVWCSDGRPMHLLFSSSVSQWAGILYMVAEGPKNSKAKYRAALICIINQSLLFLLCIYSKCLLWKRPVRIILHVIVAIIYILQDDLSSTRDVTSSSPSLPNISLTSPSNALFKSESALSCLLSKQTAPFIFLQHSQPEWRGADLRRGHRCDSSLEAGVIRTGLPPSFVPRSLVPD